MPPLNPWQIIPVPPPTLPSATAPSDAASSAALACSGRTWKPLTSLSTPSHVSATTGRLHVLRSPASAAATRASWTAPTECVFVSAIGVVSRPDSCIHCRPVTSPLPLSRNGAANSGSSRRDDDRDAGPDVVALDERRMPDTDTGDVGDRVQGSRLEVADDDAEFSKAARGNAKTARRLESHEGRGHAARRRYGCSGRGLVDDVVACARCGGGSRRVRTRLRLDR